MLRLAVALAFLLLWPMPAEAMAGVETIRLWPGAPPGRGGPDGPERSGNEGSDSGAVRAVSVPRMEVYRPARPNGTAVLVIGGGGYFRIQIESAARPIARFLQGQGVTAFVLYYRLPGDGWNADAPFQDGQRAIRLIRAGAPGWQIDPQRLGVLGSSAGGHLGGILATRGSHDFYTATDAADRHAAVPNFAALIYPVVSLRPPLDTTRTARHLRSLTDAAANFSVEEHVGPATPPFFLAHAADDPIAAVGHSLVLDAALRRAGRSSELHLFERGGHSWGMGAPQSPVAIWPQLLANWMRANGWLEPTSATR